MVMKGRGYNKNLMQDEYVVLGDIHHRVLCLYVVLGWSIWWLVLILVMMFTTLRYDDVSDLK